MGLDRKGADKHWANRENIANDLKNKFEELAKSASSLRNKNLSKFAESLMLMKGVTQELANEIDKFTK